MKRVLLIASLIATLPAVSLAQNVGKCGWGSKLFDGQRGIAPQVLAVTTNGTSGNQTFAISSGTSGCTQDGMVQSAWRTAAFIDANMNRLAKDIARGEGDTLASLSTLLNVQAQDQKVLRDELKGHFAAIFSKENVTSNEVAANLRTVLEGHPQLQGYAANV